MPRAITLVYARGPNARRCDADVADLLDRYDDLNVVAIDDLYNLPDEGPTTERLAQIAGDMLVLASIPARAVYWLLARRGVIDPAKSTPDEGNSLSADDTSPRSVICLDTREAFLPRAEAILAARLPRKEKRRVDRTGLTGLVKPPGVHPALAGEPVERAAGERWYPVVDFSRCVNCLECLDFCLFGVYGVDENQCLLVEQPDLCRDGCPACSRVCPQRAIMFPRHVAPSISGAGDADEPDPSLAELDAHVREAREARRERTHYLAEAEGEKESPASTPKKDDLDQLLDDLDRSDL